MPLARRYGWAALLAVLAVAPAAAEEPFYKGKTISLIVASNTAGGYDT